MKISGHLSLAIAAFALLSGCSGPQLPIGAPLSGSAEQPAKPPSGETLLYAVSTHYPNLVLVYDYPGKSLKQTLDINVALGTCSDANGDVFITVQGDGSEYFGYVYEYTHGGRKPIAVLPELLGMRGTPGGCSVDRTTGNLAVANGVNVAVFAGGQGTPTYYTISGLSNVNSCAYDDRGNLAASGMVNSTSKLGLAMLWSGAAQFQTYALKKRPTSLGSTIQFDGQKFGLVNFVASPSANLYRATFTKQNVHLSSAVRLQTGSYGKGFLYSPVSTWIANGTIVAPYGNNDSRIGFWKYPGGGRVQSSFDTRQQEVHAVAVSVPPSG